MELTEYDALYIVHLFNAAKNGGEPIGIDLDFLRRLTNNFPNVTPPDIYIPRQGEAMERVRQIISS